MRHKVSKSELNLFNGPKPIVHSMHCIGGFSEKRVYTFAETPAPMLELCHMELLEKEALYFRAAS